MPTARAREGRVVVVTGDVTLDWNLVRARTARNLGDAWSDTGTRAAFQPGGAALLGELVAAVAAGLGPRVPVAVHTAALPRDPPVPTDDRFHHSFALWSPFDREEEPDRPEPVWRVEEFMGLDPGPPDRASKWARVTGDPARADLLILDDAGLGFRDRPEVWPRAIASPPDPERWILLKMARPVGSGKLWERLQEHADRMIVVVRIDDLRLTEVHISRELSWERTAQDLMWELTRNPRVRALSRCAHVVVSFSTAGALLLSKDPGGGTPVCTLFYDPAVMEKMWNEEHPGGMIGYMSCLVAGLARELVRLPARPDLARGIQRGLAAMRALHLHGYDGDTGSSRSRPAFPFARVVEDLARREAPFSVSAVRDPTAGLHGATAGAEPAGEPRLWTILQDRYPGGLEAVAARIAAEGPEAALEGVPVGRFGRLLTVDRQEIEGYRSIRTLIREYAASSRPKRPLSIAVFGPPGAGKSFGIIEVATSVLPGRIKDLTFNLSQLNDPAALLDAFHQVRDVSLGGRLPLVFWDEFDTTFQGRWGWLRHFLAPMQDGTFQQSQVTHPVGPAVFVFAGGTSPRMQEFGTEEPGTFKDAKGPDFVSRLKGYVNVVGPNARDRDDPYFVIRRAILLRTMLRDFDDLFRTTPGGRVLEIDPGVLRAFLLTHSYRHGARSMESIIAMSSLSGKHRFERSCLPAEEQLGLHVEARDFISRVQQPELTGEDLDRLAEGVHVLYCAEMLADGYGWAEQSDEYLRRHPRLAPLAGRKASKGKHPTLVSFERLDPAVLEQNRGVVRDIPRKLAAAGYAVWAARAGDPPFAFTPEEIETLAEMEHDRWMRAQLAAGARYGPRRNRKKRIHPALLPWTKLTDEERLARYGDDAARLGTDELPEEEKEKDRSQVRGIDGTLAAAGYTALRLSDPSRGP